MKSTPTHSNSVSALVLAGGKALRMEGRDKGLVLLSGQPMIQHVLQKLKPQLDLIRINANRNPEHYAALGYPVLADQLTDYQGPLAGMARGLEDCPTPWLLVVPCDTPFLPEDLVGRLLQQALATDAEIAVAHDGRRLQPVVSLLKRELHGSLMAFLDSGERKIDRWYQQQCTVEVDFSDCPDGFINVNSLQDKQTIENQAAGL